MKIDASFVTSATAAGGFPRDGLREVAFVGRSNVGKSSLINALLRQRIARTSAAPGKTRLANIYRVARGSGTPFYLVDLPGYGYARGGDAAAREFETLAAAYFGRPDGGDRAALLLVDSRHPGLQSDLDAWRWLTAVTDRCAVVATKIDKLARGERIRALAQLESVFEHPARPVSVVTGEGLEDLWKQIDRPNSRPPSRPPSPQPREQAPPRKRSSASTSRR